MKRGSTIDGAAMGLGEMGILGVLEARGNGIDFSRLFSESEL